MLFQPPRVCNWNINGVLPSVYGSGKVDKAVELEDRLFSAFTSTLHRSISIACAAIPVSEGTQLWFKRDSTMRIIVSDAAELGSKFYASRHTSDFSILLLCPAFYGLRGPVIVTVTECSSIYFLRWGGACDGVELGNRLFSAHKV